MYQIYTIDTLKSKSLAQLKEIASKVGAVASDKRAKQSWIDAILDKQPKPAQPVKFDVDGDNVTANGEAIASITLDEQHLTQPWTVKIDDAVIHRTATWAQAYNYICWHHKQGTLVKPQADEPVDVHNEPQPVVSGALIFESVKPKQSIFKSAYKVISNSRDIGVIFMRRDGFWVVEGRDTLLDTPYQAAVALEELRLVTA